MSEKPTEKPIESDKPQASTTDSISTTIESAGFVQDLSVPIEKNIITPSSNTISSVSTNDILAKANHMVAEASLSVEKFQNKENEPTSSIPSFFNDLSDLCRHCCDNPIKSFKNPTGRNYAHLLDGRSKQYIASKKSILAKFFNILTKHDTFCRNSRRRMKREKRIKREFEDV